MIKKTSAPNRSPQYQSLADKSLLADVAEEVFSVPCRAPPGDILDNVTRRTSFSIQSRPILPIKKVAGRE
ncbi:hypothetical protein [Paraburkholderia xenovorans]|uniref:hypothetical protein n=1 Tax=Paraburkholderia xenovorans TaxID=36873 RepID=UPI0038B72AA0